MLVSIISACSDRRKCLNSNILSEKRKHTLKFPPCLTLGTRRCIRPEPVANIRTSQPVRGFRVHGDENAIPSQAPNKALHTRNKSSPALYSAANAGAVKPGLKRAAFGDVSNTIHINRPLRDDNSLGVKIGVEVKHNKVQLEPEQKAAAPLLKPPHRPASMTTSIKNLIVNVGNTSLSARLVGDGNQQGQATGNIRKVLSRKNTTIFKDYNTTSNFSQGLSGANEALPPVRRETGSQPQQQKVLSAHGGSHQPSLPKSQTTSHRTIPIYEDTVPTASEVHEVVKPEVGVKTHQKISEEKSHEHHGVDENGVERSHDVLKDESPVIPAGQVIPILEEAQAQPVVQHEVAHRNVLQPLREPEEYWDVEEDEEDNYDEEGYVTARSFRSGRGENVTGNATTTLVPRVNVKVRKEIAAAKELVESMRTPEDIEDDYWDTSMVVEYGEEIFSYMRELEVCSPRHTKRTLPTTNPCVDQDATQSTLYGFSDRDPMVHAFSPYGLAYSGPPSVPASARDSLPLCQLHRSFLVLQDRLARQVAACWSYCNLRSRQV